MAKLLDQGKQNSNLLNLQVAKNVFTRLVPFAADVGDRIYLEYTQCLHLHAHLRAMQQGLHTSKLGCDGPLSSAMVAQGIRIAVQGFEEFVVLLGHNCIPATPGTVEMFTAEQRQAFHRVRFSIRFYNTALPFPHTSDTAYHWSVVIYDRENVTAYYFDSMCTDDDSCVERAESVKAEFSVTLEHEGLRNDMFGFIVAHTPPLSYRLAGGVHVIESVRAFFHEHRLENWHHSLLYKTYHGRDLLVTDADLEDRMIRNWTFWSGAAFGRYCPDLEADHNLIHRPY
ncbi:hypothetical protein F4677DRAFT_442995 [Hypoxylon crocopeplum]|nr:hypothetical protein F4677DRAFT_442995 [Hypoxylon crocopeplum]